MLAFTMDGAYARLRSRTEGLTDDEFFWQPRPDSWTIYEDRPGHWTYNYEVPDPDPAPLSTIAWQVVHVAMCKVMYHEWAYGAARMTWPEMVTPSNANDAIALLEEGQRLLKHDLDNETESGLDRKRLTNWGEPWPAWRIFTAMADHDALHTGTIGCLRDLYLWTRAARA
jgi:DinB superfamily